MNLDMKKDEYIIVEIIPTHSNSKVGEIVQISALKIKGLKLLQRFDYRLNLDLIKNADLKNMLSYDKDNFKYVKSSKSLLDAFKKFIEDIPLLIIDNSYTKDYLEDITNTKESIFKYLNLEFREDIFDILRNKYHLEPTNHLVDLLYESLLFETNTSLDEKN